MREGGERRERDGWRHKATKSSMRYLKADLLASSPGHSQNLSRSYGEKTIFLHSCTTYQDLWHTVFWNESSEEISGDETVAPSSRDTPSPALALSEGSF